MPAQCGLCPFSGREYELVTIGFGERVCLLLASLGPYDQVVVPSRYAESRWF